MSYFCLRIDLDYVPWDAPDAAEFGHGEPAVTLKLMEIARISGYKLHFFTSTRVMRAFPATTDAVLNEGHELDWLCKHPLEGKQRFEAAQQHFANLGIKPLGMALKGSWPAEAIPFWPEDTLKFVSATPGPIPSGLKFYAVDVRAPRDAVRSGMTARSWSESVKMMVREAASRNIGVTIPIRPQVMSALDPKLSFIREVLDLAHAIGLPMRTLREVYGSEK